MLDLSAIADVLVGRVDELETLIDFHKLNPLYTSIKGYFCCTLPDVMHNIWKDLTITGRRSYPLLHFTISMDSKEYSINS